MVIFNRYVKLPEGKQSVETLKIEAKYVPQDEFQKWEVHSDPH